MKIGQVSFREVQGDVVPYGGHLGFIDEATTTPPERLLAAAGH